MMRRALLLAGHGSHLDPGSSRPVHEQARRLRERGTFDEVHVAFWKEEPALSRAFDACGADDVTVVPVFISGGYFTGQVLPRELGLSGAISDVRGKRVRYTAPVGSHPALARVVIERAAEAGATASTGVAVLGHGTPRNPDSERNVYEQAERVRQTGRFAEVAAVFLDQEPDMRGVFRHMVSEQVVMVPLFIADGWHVGVSIPEDLSLDGDERRSGGRRLRYTPAVGTHPLVAEVIDELAAEASTWA